jgi:hypothetical protein
MAEVLPLALLLATALLAAPAPARLLALLRLKHPRA